MGLEEVQPRPLILSRVCQICATAAFGETEKQRVTSGLRMRQASQVTDLLKVLVWLM